MTQEEKQLLLKDLCARLPYSVWGLHRGEDLPLYVIDNSGAYMVLGYNAWFDLETVPFKPYLRPISSMTDEEKDELFDWGWATNANDIFSDGSNDLDNEYQTYQKNLYDVRWLIDWLNAHHFDYQGLIEKGLALTASEGMYKTE